MATITKEIITTRKVTLLKELNEVKANMNALIGALQDCEYWLSQITEEEKKD
jgi:hypothetical protein